MLRTIKDPIMSSIDGVEYIPQAKIASLFAVFGLVIVYNKLLDSYPKHHVFYMMGLTYGVLFFIIACLLLHPTIGLPNSRADPSRLLGWVSYVGIESFGSMVVQCYWALVNSSVNVDFAKKNFGYIVAGAQIGSVLGPSVATQADTIGVPGLYLLASLIMFCMVAAMKFYMDRFGQVNLQDEEVSKKAVDKKDKGGIMEGFYLFYDHNYVKGIFAVSSLYMIQVTVIDYMLKVLAKTRYDEMYPNDPQSSLKGFATFMGYFGICTNGISFLMSMFGTGSAIKAFGLSACLISFPLFMLICTALIFVYPDIWMVFMVMMFIKAMSYALNNPTKEILYQVTSSAVKFKCKSWIDTFGQRGSKAAGSIITNAFADSLVQLINYGTLVGVVIGGFTLWIADYMGKEFDNLHKNGEKVGEEPLVRYEEVGEDGNVKDSSCVDADDELGDTENNTKLQEPSVKETTI